MQFYFTIYGHSALYALLFIQCTYEVSGYGEYMIGFIKTVILRSNSIESHILYSDSTPVYTSQLV